MSDYHPNLDGPAEPIGLAMDSQQSPAQSELASARGSANASPAKEALKKEIARLMDDAFTAGFDADNAGALGHFDGFALADAAIEKHWPNTCVSDGPADGNDNKSSAEGPFAARNG